ncbi:MAG TPA: hypothetical protein PLN42_09995 [Anaerolineae bacterium]|nr:hypothetical protein [Anaerolineae bacterium]
MHISTVMLKDFRKLAHCELQLSDQVTLLLGDEGAGKSSIAGAIGWALAGWCQWTDTAGKGGASLIRNGMPTARAELSTDFGLVSRTVSPKGGSLAVGDRTGKDAEALLMASLPTADLLAVCLRTGHFLEAAPKQQQDILFSLAGGEVNAAWFEERLTAAEREVLAGDLNTRLAGSALSDRLYQTAYGARTEANRTLKQLQAQVGAETEASQEPRTVGSAEANLAQLRKALEDVQRQIGEAEANRQAHERAKQRWEAATAERKRAEETLATIGEPPAVLSSDEVLALVTEGTHLEENLRLLEAECARLEATRRLLTEQVETFANLSGCVLSGIDCPLSKKQRQEAVNAANEQHRKAGELYEELSAKATAEREKLTAVCARTGANQEAEMAADRHQQRVAEAKSALERAEVALKQALDEYQETTPVDVTGLQQQATDLRSRIATIEQQMAAERDRVVAQERKKKLDADLQQAEARAKLLDELVKKLGPDGLPAQAMAATLGKVLDQINQVLAEISEFRVEAEPGKEFRLLVSGPNGVLPVAMLSEGEQFRVGAAIQVAFAYLTGLDFVIVDRTNVLDSTHRGQLIRMLLQAPVQSLVLAIPANGKRPVAPGLAVYDLNDGKLQAVAA